jgi:hypothetical protein
VLESRRKRIAEGRGRVEGPQPRRKGLPLIKSRLASGFCLRARREAAPTPTQGAAGSSWTTSTSPIPADSSVQIGSAASSPSYTWLFGTDNTTGEPMILEHS